MTGVIEAAGGEDVYTFVVPSGGMEVFADVVCFWQERLEILDVSGAVVKTGCNKQTHSLAAGSYTLRTFSVTRDFGAYRLIRAQS